MLCSKRVRFALGTYRNVGTTKYTFYKVLKLENIDAKLVSRLNTYTNPSYSLRHRSNATKIKIGNEKFRIKNSLFTEFY